MLARMYLERRNTLWRTLREHAPGERNADPFLFGSALEELQTLIGWSRQRVLAGLGLAELLNETERLSAARWP